MGNKCCVLTIRQEFNIEFEQELSLLNTLRYNKSRYFYIIETINVYQIILKKLDNTYNDYGNNRIGFTNIVYDVFDEMYSMTIKSNMTFVEKDMILKRLNKIPIQETFD